MVDLTFFIDLQEKIPSLNFSKQDSLNDFRIRSKHRIDFPGLCAIDFENIIRIVVKHIVGWGNDGRLGLFGEADAYGLAVEEQGRKTLHAHIMVYVKFWNELMSSLLKSQPGGRVHKNAIKEMEKYLDAIGSASLSSSGNTKMDEWNPFDHVCALRRKQKKLVPKEKLVYRQMRHKHGWRLHQGRIAKCHKCDSEFTSEQVVESAFKKIYTGPNTIEWPTFPDRKFRTMDSPVINHQMDFDWLNRPVDCQGRRLFVFNANFNLHASEHARRCFKRGMECFANLPMPCCKKTKLNFEKSTFTPAATTEIESWFDYLGSKFPVHLFSVERLREMESCFMNTHNAITTLIFGCNNNVTSGVMGKGVIYMTCYNAKATQDDDKESFNQVGKALAKQITRQNEAGTELNEIERWKNGLNRVLLGWIANSNSAVISGPLARYVIFKESRFEFSHDFTPAMPEYVRAMLFNEDVSLYQRRFGKEVKPFCIAMHFLYRPKELENMSFYEFYMTTSVRNAADLKNQESFEFTSEHPFRDFERVVYNITLGLPEKVPCFTWSWLPSTKNLGGKIMSGTTGKWVRNTKVKSLQERCAEEEYCKRFLILFTSIRKEEDLVRNGSFVDQFVHVHNLGTTLFRHASYIAGNIQQIHNSLASKMIPDGLAMETEEYIRQVKTDESNYTY